jgi:hypothetical protein
MSNKHLLQQIETVSYECTTALTPFYIDILSNTAKNHLMLGHTI